MPLDPTDPRIQEKLARLRQLEDQAAQAEVAEQKKAVARHDAKLQRAQHDFRHFLEYVVKDERTNDPIKLAAIHLSWIDHIDYCWSRGLIAGILAPRGSGKTSLSEAIPLFLFGHNPALRIQVVSCSDSLAKKRVSKIRDYIENSKEYHEVFPNVKQHASMAWTTTEIFLQRHTTARDPSLHSKGIMSTALGNRVDVLIADDINDQKNTLNNPMDREKVFENYTTTFLPCMESDSRAIFLATRWHECFLPETRVATEQGLRPISFIKRGERVWTSQGLQPVTATNQRWHSGEVVSLDLRGWPELVRCTPDHRFQTPAGWRTAGSLSKGDWVLLDIPKLTPFTEEELKDCLPLPPPPQGTATRWLTGVRGRITREALAERLDAGLTYGEIAQEYGLKSRSSVYNYARLYDLNRPRHYVVDDAILLDMDFWRIVGYWLAEGDLHSGRVETEKAVVRFVFGPDEQSYVDEIRTVMQRYDIPVGCQSSESGFRVTFSSIQIARFLHDNFGFGAAGKRLPPWIGRLSEDAQRALLLGYARGDGHVDAKLRSVRPISVSLNLIHGFQQLALRLGCMANVFQVKEDRWEEGSGCVQAGYRKAVYELRIPVDADSWLADGRPVKPYTRNHRRQSYILGDYLAVRVHTVTREPYEGLVYDLTTPAHDFLLGRATVHNCDTFGLIMKDERMRQAYGWLVQRIYEDCENIECSYYYPGGPETHIAGRLDHLFAIAEERLTQ